MAEKKFQVELVASLAAPGWVGEKGTVIEVPLADARRLIARGMAKEVAEAKLPKATPEEEAASRVQDVETAERIIDPVAKLETAVRVRPRGQKMARPPQRAGRVED